MFHASSRLLPVPSPSKKLNVESRIAVDSHTVIACLDAFFADTDIALIAGK